MLVSLNITYDMIPLKELSVLYWNDLILINIFAGKYHIAHYKSYLDDGRQPDKLLSNYFQSKHIKNRIVLTIYSRENIETIID